jgi:hypothetical protein
MKIGKINIRVGKMKLKGAKVFIEGRITIIDNENKLNSYGNEKVYIYIKEGYISWKKNNNIEKELKELINEVKENGRAINNNY